MTHAHPSQLQIWQNITTSENLFLFYKVPPGFRHPHLSAHHLWLCIRTVWESLEKWPASIYTKFWGKLDLDLMETNESDVRLVWVALSGKSVGLGSRAMCLSISQVTHARLVQITVL